MEKEKPKIKVIDVQTEQVLFECSIEHAEKAHQFAAEMEEMGLDLKVLTPTMTDTLSHSLGLSREAHEAYKQSLEEEMEHHEGSCCFKKPENDDQGIH
jgi:tRNA A-37 threonylcarbamoyl transferase component Bud32